MNSQQATVSNSPDPAPPRVLPGHTVFIEAGPEDSAREDAKPSDVPDAGFRTVQIWLLVIFVAAMLLVLGFAYRFLFRVNMTNEVVSVLIPQPFTENNDFMYFHLDNQMKVLLVRPNTGLNSSYVSLTVGVGSEHDVEGFVGFTHLIEHLLFTGSRNFPGDHYIEKIVNKHQGEQNGVTKAFTTSFYFKVDNAGLKEFIPALVDAIQNPTFSEENILKEVNNVNSEISMRMTFNKNMAYYKILKALGNPSSRLFQDGFANIEAAQLDPRALRDRLLAFHNQYYSSNIMTLTIISDQDFRTTRQKIEKHFSTIPNRHVERTFFNTTQTYVSPFAPDVFGRIIFVEGFTEPSKLTLVFQSPSDLENTRFRPLDFFSYFLNYFSERSLKQRLIDRGLITSFSDSIPLQDYVNSVYIVSFTLTPEGLSRPSAVIQEFFRFVEFVRRIPDKAAVFSDLSKASKYSFLFGVKSEFMDFSAVDQSYFDRAADFSEALQDFTPHQIFTAKNVMFTYNETEFGAVLDSLRPDNAFFLLESSKFNKTRPADSPVPTRRLTQLFHNLAAEERTDSDFSDFFGLKEQPFIKVPKGEGRVLADLQVDSGVTQTVESQNHFDFAANRIVLEDSFDFDNGRMYTTTNVPPATLQELFQTPDVAPDAFETQSSFDTSHLNAYNMVTRCQAPHSLAEAELAASEATPEVIAFVNKLDQVPSQHGGIHTPQLFNAIFPNEESPSDLAQRYHVLRDLLIYKLCILKDFEADDKQLVAKKVSESAELSVYHQLFRKTLQPKSVLTLTLESGSILSGIMEADYSAKVEKALLLEVLCMYAMRHVEFDNRAEFVKGSDFSCRVSNFRVVLEFEGFTEHLETFVSRILASFRSLTQPALYRPNVLRNFRQRIMDTYSQFTAITSLKSSTFYLNLVMDKIFIDNSSPAKVELIRALIARIDPASLSQTMLELLSTHRLSVLGVGNLEQPLVERIAESSRALLRVESSQVAKQIDFLEFRRFMSHNFQFRISRDEHLLVRLPNIDPSESNSVYLTYFQIKKLSRSVRVNALILNHFLKKLVYDHLRNNLNLGYVTQSGLKVYYRNVGLVILVQGEKFRPHKLEAVIDDMLQSFLHSLNNISAAELSVVKFQILSELTEFSSSLQEVSEKYYDGIEEAILEKDERPYAELVQEVSPATLRDFAESFLTRRSRRLTIELFAGEVRPKERDFRLESTFTLSQREYSLVTLDQLVKRKAVN